MAQAAEFQPIDDPALSPAGVVREHDLIAPRISIEAFCVTPGFASAMQTAARDRRMAKTRCTVGMGGAQAASKRYANVSTPNLVIVESNEGGFGIFRELEALAGVCGDDVNVIVAGPSNDVSLYRELVRQGVSEYLVSPPSPMQIIEAVTTVYATPETAPAARSLAVFGVRGGVGASVLSHNIGAMIARQMRKETVIVDLDLEFGTTALDFNAEAKSTMADAIADVDELDDVKLGRMLWEQEEHLRLLAAPASVRARATLDGQVMQSLLDTVRAAADFVVLDTPHQWSPAVVTTLRQSENVVLVATPDLASLRNLKTVYDWLKSERQHDAAPKIVLNQVGMPKRPEIAAKEFAEIVGAPVDLVIPFEPAIFGAAQNDGKMLADVAGAKKLVEPLETFVQGMFGAKSGAKPAEGSAGFDLSSLIARVTGRG